MSYTPYLPQKFIEAWKAAAAFFPPNWTAVLVCLAVWTFGALWLVAWLSDRQWFRRIALTTIVVNAAVLLHTNGLETLGGILATRSLPLPPLMADRPRQLELELGLLMLLGVLFVHYRWLERVNARRTLPDITVEKLVDANGLPQAGLEAILRDSINRASPHSPSRYPGGSVEYLRDFGEKPIEPSWWVARISLWGLRVAFPPRTLKVSGALVPGKPEHDEPAGVTVTVEEMRTRSVVFSRTIRAPSPQDAVEQAAYRVAEYAIQRCPTLPKWAYWSQENESSAFLEYWRGVRAGKHTRESLEDARKHLHEAARQSPSSVLPRLQLAAVLEAQQRYLDAMELCASVAGRFRLLFDARYRLALLLRKAGCWLDGFCKDEQEQRRFAQAFEAPVCGMSGNRVPLREPGQNRDDYCRLLSSYLHDEAMNLQQQLLRDLTWWRMAWWCLRHTAERRYLWPRYLRNGSRRKAARAAVWTAQCCTKLLGLQMQYPAGPPPSEMRDLESAAVRAVGEHEDERKRAERGWWGIAHYNLACFYALQLRALTPGAARALRPDEDEIVRKAVHHLDVAAMDPYGPFSSGSLWWMTVEYDRDLELLRAHERFKNWQERNLLTSEESVRGQECRSVS